MLHGRKEISFVSIIMFILRPDALSLNLNGSVMINQSINQSINHVVSEKWHHFCELPYTEVAGKSSKTK
jgi:hypothetical protein